MTQDHHSQNQSMNSQQRRTLMAVLAYILFLIPILTGDAKKDEFINFHVKQGFVLFILAVLVNISLNVLPAVLWWNISWVLSLATFVLFVIGVNNALKGKKEVLPIIGHFAEHFKF